MVGSDKKTILLVEDEIINAMLVKDSLEKYGYTVIHAINGEQTINIFKKNNNIDLILMDIDLGKGLDGTEAADIILKEHDIPVVFLSSHTEPDVVEKTEKITSYGYVVKNSSITVLDASIKMAFKLFEAKIKEQTKDVALNESQKTAQWLLDIAAEIIISLDADGTIILLNKSGHNLLGYSAPELIGKNWIETCTPPESRDDMRRFFGNLRAGKTGTREAVENKVLMKSGEQRIISWHMAVHKDKDGKFTGFVSSGKDVTERKQAEEYLKKYQNIVSSTSEGIAFLDQNYRYIIANDSYTKYFTDGSKKIIGLTIGDHFGLDSFRDRIKGYFDECLTGEVIHYQEWRETRYLGRRLIDITYTPYTDTSNRISGVIVNTKDLTEHQTAGNEGQTDIT